MDEESIVESHDISEEERVRSGMNCQEENHSEDSCEGIKKRGIYGMKEVMKR